MDLAKCLYYLLASLILSLIHLHAPRSSSTWIYDMDLFAHTLTHGIEHCRHLGSRVITLAGTVRVGLSEENTRSELCAFQKEQARVYACKQLGLPEDSTWAAIASKRSQIAIITECQRRNLAETSTWADITAYDCTHK